MSEVIVRRIGRDYLDALVRVYMDSFEHDESEFEQNRNKWIVKHFENPCGESYIFGAFDGNELVGMNCFLRMPYTYKGEKLNIVQSCESGVLHSHQRQGIWGKVMNFADQYFRTETDLDAVIGFPNYKNSYPGFVKMGWKTLFNEKNMLLVNNGRKAVETYVENKWWLRLGGILGIQRIKINFENTNNLTVNKVDHMKGLKYKDIKEVDHVCLEIFDEWLKWKKRYEGLEIYEVSIKNSEKTIAYILASTDKLNGIPYLKIMKVISDGDGKGHRRVITAFLKSLKHQNISLVRAWDREGTIYKKLGFIEMKSHVNPFIMNILNEEKGLGAAESWNPGFLDLD